MPPASPAIHKFGIIVEQSLLRIGVICFVVGSIFTGTPNNLLNSVWGEKPSPAAINSQGILRFSFVFKFERRAPSTRRVPKIDSISQLYRTEVLDLNVFHLYMAPSTINLGE